MLSKKQKLVFEYIKEYIEREGISPTQREIKDFFNLKNHLEVFKDILNILRTLVYYPMTGTQKEDWN